MTIRTALAASFIVAGCATAGCSSGPDGSALGQVPADQPAASSRVGSDGADGVTIRRVWPEHDAGFYASSISPDGRYLSMIDWSTSNLAVRDLSTGELHRLTNVRNEKGKAWEHAGVSVFSPDGRKLVVGWDYIAEGHSGSDLQLRVIDFDPDETGVPRVGEGKVLFYNPEVYPYFVFDWSPDGSQVLAKVYPRPPSTTSNQLALISTADGTYRALRSFDWREPLRAEFSPDGRFVAYDFLPDVDSPNRDLFVLSVDGTYEARIAADPAFDRLLGWHPDGSILFESERGGTPGVWRLPMAEGRPAGAAELLKADMWGIEPLGFVGDRFYYGLDVASPRLYTATMDLASGRLTSAPVAIGDPARLGMNGWEWSPDGRLLAYSATTPGAMGSLIGIRSATGEELQTIRLELGASSLLRWDPNGQRLVVFARDAKGRRGFHRIDLETGSSSMILHTDGLDEPTWRGNFELSGDGGTIYFATAPAFGQPPTLVAYDIESGADRVVLASATELYGNVAISPDGGRLAFVAPGPGGNVVSTVPVRGDAVTPVSKLSPDLAYTWGLQWTADGQSILVVTSGAVDLERQLWIVPADGGEARKVEFDDPLGVHHFLAMRGTSPLRLHPDGRQIAFLAGKLRGEIWTMDGIPLTGAQPAQKEAGR